MALERRNAALRLALPAEADRPWVLGQRLAAGEVDWPVRGASVAAVLAKEGLAAPPAGFDTEEGFVLAIGEAGVTVGADSGAGRFYALQALAQLALAAPREGSVAAVAPLLVIDWPRQRLRGAHVCYHLVQPFMPYNAPDYAALMERVAQLAHLRVNTLLLELESLFPFRKAMIANELAFTREQIGALVAVCRRMHMRVIPMVQCLGHAYNVLRHREYAHLRETVETTQQYCPTNLEVREFYLELVDDVLEVFAPVDTFHLGGDESRRLGECDRCRAVVASEGTGALYGRHVGELCRRVSERGVTPMVWGDMFEHHPSALDFIPRDAVVMYWNYDPFQWSRPLVVEQLMKGGRAAVLASAARSGSHSHTMFSYPKAMRGIAAISQLSEAYAAEGSLVTDWTKAAAADLTLPCLAYGAGSAWGDSADRGSFARRFAQLRWGREWEWEEVYELLAVRVPYCDDVLARLPERIDRLDRLDVTAGTFGASVVKHTRQADRTDTVAALGVAGERAAAARKLLDAAAADGISRDDVLWAHLDLSCQTQAYWSELGVVVDTAVRLLKFPAAGDEGVRSKTTARLASALEDWDGLREAWRDLMARTTFPVVAERNAAYRFADDARWVLGGMLDDLRESRQRSSALPVAMA